MSNFPKPNEIEELLEFYSDKLEEFTQKFNPFFSEKSSELKKQTDDLKSRVEKYSHYIQNDQLKHLTLSDGAKQEIEKVFLEMGKVESKYKELEKMFRFGENIL